MAPPMICPSGRTSRYFCPRVHSVNFEARPGPPQSSKKWRRDPYSNRNGNTGDISQPDRCAECSTQSLEVSDLTFIIGLSNLPRTTSMAWRNIRKLTKLIRTVKKSAPMTSQATTTGRDILLGELLSQSIPKTDAIQPTVFQRMHRRTRQSLHRLLRPQWQPLQVSRQLLLAGASTACPAASFSAAGASTGCSASASAAC